MTDKHPTTSAPGINQPGAGQLPAPGTEPPKENKQKKSGDVGTLRYHILCSYHSDLPDHDTLEAAHEAAAAHLASHHADATGAVAKNAEVMITEVTHFSSDDALTVQPVTKH